MLNGPDIRKLIKSQAFNSVLTEDEVRAWDNIQAVINGFLGKHRVDGYEILIRNMLDSFDELGISMSLKIHFLHHHLNFFVKQMASESDEQGERFHQIIMPMEKRFKGKGLNAMLGELCWWSKTMHKYQIENDEDTGEDEE